MKTLEQIRNEIAIKYNAKDWDDYLLFMIRLKTTSKRMTVVFDEIAETYANQFHNLPPIEDKETENAEWRRLHLNKNGVVEDKEKEPELKVYYCTVCRQKVVDAENGYDTCSDCLSKM